ncbi:HNH endonuclease [Halosolutus amylolyticus]|uniref:HNH endonuclease n=1 Tax=Halosolutus amylolyticus TaxID=2932267 RepID=A0ABD5PIU2_9EURY
MPAAAGLSNFIEGSEEYLSDQSSETWDSHQPQAWPAETGRESEIDVSTAVQSNCQSQTENRYPENWDILRRQAYKRDEYRCRNCGAGGGPHGNVELHAHHIVPLSCGGTNALSNLSTLCSTCHGLIHDHMD